MKILIWRFDKLKRQKRFKLEILLGGGRGTIWINDFSKTIYFHMKIIQNILKERKAVEKANYIWKAESWVKFKRGQFYFILPKTTSVKKTGVCLKERFNGSLRILKTVLILSEICHWSFTGLILTKYAYESFCDPNATNGH